MDDLGEFRAACIPRGGEDEEGTAAPPLPQPPPPRLSATGSPRGGRGPPGHAAPLSAAAGLRAGGFGSGLSAPGDVSLPADRSGPPGWQRWFTPSRPPPPPSAPQAPRVGCPGGHRQAPTPGRGAGRRCLSRVCPGWERRPSVPYPGRGVERGRVSADTSSPAAASRACSWARCVTLHGCRAIAGEPSGARRAQPQPSVPPGSELFLLLPGFLPGVSKPSETV